jgi:hypothetical protein
LKNQIRGKKNPEKESRQIPEKFDQVLTTAIRDAHRADLLEKMELKMKAAVDRDYEEELRWKDVRHR